MAKDAELQEDKKATKDTADAGQDADNEKTGAATALSNEAFAPAIKPLSQELNESNKAAAVGAAKENSEKGGTLDNSEYEADRSRFIRDIADLFIPPVEKTGGTHDLKTGDRLVMRDGKETLVTPSGDIITVRQDGGVNIEGDVKEVSNHNGHQVYTMRDGATITVGKDGISEIKRDGKIVFLTPPDERRHVTGPIKLSFHEKPGIDPRIFEKRLQNK